MNLLSGQRGKCCSDESFGKKIEYIRYNPVSAGLVREPEQRAYVFFMIGRQERGGGGPRGTALPCAGLGLVLP
jgi:hypothetical protein